MKFDPVFNLNIAGIAMSFGVLAWAYIWPWIRTMSKYRAIKFLAVIHMFRFVGLSFLVPGVVSPLLPPQFAVPAAWGDFGAAILAITVVISLSKRWLFSIALVWFFNLWGTVDLIYAIYNDINQHVDAGLLGAAFYIPTVIVPALLVSHTLIFIILLRSKNQV
jgi:hypothetical protein